MVEKQQEEFELVPLAPIRRLERRVEQLEGSTSLDAKEFLREIVDIVRMNQQLVDELAKANDALRIELSRLPGRIEELVSNLKELLSYIKASATEETGMPSDSLRPLIEKLDQLIEGNKKVVESNQNITTALEDLDRRTRRPAQPLPPLRKPVLPLPIR